MREGEPEYWDGIAEKMAPKEGAIYDNWLKRRILGQFLLKCEWSGSKVLEIGVGCGATAALLGLACGKQWEYTGTDVSAKFANIASRFALNVIQTDVLNLPEGEFDRIIALDSLEHVHPDDRVRGYCEIAKRLSKGGLLFINMPHDRSLHDLQFDHGIGLKDIMMLEGEGLMLTKYDHYEIQYQNYRRGYDFVVMTK